MSDNKLTSLNPNPLLATYGAPETMPNLGAGVQSLVDIVRGYGRDAAVSLSDPYFYPFAAGMNPEGIRNLVQGYQNNHLLDAMGQNVNAQSDEIVNALTGRGEPGAALNMGLGLMTGYHGTPHTFDRFSLDHMGTGEGAQAYGWGLYFAENPEVAAGYQKTLSHPSGAVLRTTTDANMVLLYKLQDAAMQVNKNLPSNEFTSAIVKHLRDEAKSAHPYDTKTALDAADALENGLFTAHPANLGNIYRADLPEDDELLHWDKPLSEQPEKVRKALVTLPKRSEQYDIAREAGSGRWALFAKDNGYMDTEHSSFKSEEEAQKFLDDPSGEDYYRYLSENFGNEQAASKHLASLGIPGLKYLDAGSRSEGKGTHNYVIWDEDRIKHLGHAGDPAPVPEAVVPAAVPDPASPMAPAVPAKANALTNPPAPTPVAAPGEFPLAGETVDGRTVRDSIPNQSSIGASLTDYKVLKGVREIPMSAMDPEYVSSIQKVGLNKRTKALQDAIKESGEINPLIVVQDKDGLYVLEGSHRYDALAHAGTKSFPALVVKDLESLQEKPTKKAKP